MLLKKLVIQSVALYKQSLKVYRLELVAMYIMIVN
ncbi:Uncharacterised protein [Mycobacteroides abscessus]|nr:Uncharacterised protein [Mycobacteroides abscessus]